MGFGPFSSDSRTTSRVQNIDNSQTQGDGSRASQFRSGGNKGATAQADSGSISVTGKGNTTNLTTTVTDLGAISLAGELVGKAIDAQSSFASGALGATQHLAETRLTDGQNIVGKNAVYIVLGLAALIVAALVFKGRH